MGSSLPAIDSALLLLSVAPLNTSSPKASTLPKQYIAKHYLDGGVPVRIEEHAALAAMVCMIPAPELVGTI